MQPKPKGILRLIDRLAPRFGGRGKRILANAAYLSAGRVIQLLANLTVGIYVARYLGPAQWGVLAYAISFVGLFGGIATLGLDNIVVRDLAADPSADANADRILATAFVLRLIASITTFAAVAASIVFVQDDWNTIRVVLIVASAVLFQPLSVIDLYYQSRMQSKYVVGAQTVAICITSLVRIVLVFAHASVVAFAWMAFADTAIAMLGLVVIYGPNKSFGGWRAERALAYRLLADAWPLALTAVFTAIYVNVDRVMIKHFLGEASAGKYAVVLSISTAIYFVPLVLGQSAFPALVEARRDPADYQRRLQQCFDVFLWGAVAVALPTSLFAEPLMRLVYGPAYAGAGAALAIHIWSAVVTLLGVVTSYWLVAEGLQRLYPVRILASAAVCIGLNVLLIPRIGIRGAAVATLVAQFMSSTVVFAFSERTRLMPLLQFRALLLPLRLWSARGGVADSKHHE